MNHKKRVGMLLSALLFSLISGAVMADLAANLADIKNKAAKIDSASGNDKTISKKSMLDAVKAALAEATTDADIKAIITAAVSTSPSSAADIVSAAVITSPSKAAAITGAAVAAAPSQAYKITQVAVKAAPSKAADIAVAALDNAPANQSNGIINAAISSAPKDSTTLSTLQSLSYKGQRDNSPNNNHNNKDNNNNNNNNNLEERPGGGASPT